MINTVFLVTFLLLIAFIRQSFCMNSMQTSIASYSASNPLLTSSLRRRYSLATGSDIQSLLMSGSKSGTQPTIVAIPLYIRNNLSRYPSIFELLSSNSNQQIDTKLKKFSEIQSNVSDGTNWSKKSVEDNTKPNDFVSNYSTQRYRIQPQKSVKYSTEEPKVVRQRDSNKYEIELKDSSDYLSPQKSQWSSQTSNTPNRYLHSYSRHSQRFPTEEYRKQSQSQPEFESISNTYSSNNKYNENIPIKEQKVVDSSDYGSVDGIKTNSETYNRNNVQNYSPFSSSTEGKVVHRNIGSEKSSYSQSSDASQEKPNFAYSEPSIRDENYSTKNDNKYENNDYKYSNKNNDYEYRLNPINIRSYERSVQSNQFTTTPINAYNSRPGFRQSYVNSFVTSKPLITSSDEDSSDSISSDNYNNNYNSNFQPIISSNAYNSQSNPSNSGPDSQTNGYVANPSVYIPETQSDSPNNNYMKTESKSQFTPNSNPNYSSDYSTPEDIDCFDENSNDYKSSYSSIKSQNRPEIDSKNNESDNYETQDLDPTKLDVKIVHLPVSLLRRLIGSGDISLPSYNYQ